VRRPRWLAGTGLLFLQETTALQRRPAVTVAPVIGAIQDPLPVLIALAAGAERWGSRPSQVTRLIIGLAAVTLGAVALGRSRAVDRVAAKHDLDRSATSSDMPAINSVSGPSPRASLSQGVGGRVMGLRAQEEWTS